LWDAVVEEALVEVHPVDRRAPTTVVMVDARIKRYQQKRSPQYYSKQ
jgi:hypothetical protein